MATVFGQEERKFYNAFFIADATERQAALTRWIHSTKPIVQAAIAKELEQFVKATTENRWTDEGWKQGEEKMRRMENDFHLVMDIKLRRLASNENFQGSLPEPVERIKIGSEKIIQETPLKIIMSKTEIDLHGMTASEAILHVREFLKDCDKANEKTVWIIHGKGTGVLKEETRKLLSNHPLVKSFSVADPRHGGEGATQVNIK